MKKNQLESYQHAKQREGKRNPLQDYDFEELPELSEEQLKAFKGISKNDHQIFNNAHIKRLGRPPKNVEEKENLISIRFSNELLTKIKKKAREEGYKSYQKFIKETLANKVG